MQALRFISSGSTVAVVNLGLGLALSGPCGVEIQVAIPVAYFLSTLLNYCLQRWFVFGHNRAEFALSARSQFVRYVGVGGAQYGVTALATARLPAALGVDEQLVYVATALAAAAVTFTIFRLRVFHAV